LNKEAKSSTKFEEEGCDCQGRDLKKIEKYEKVVCRNSGTRDAHGGTCLQSQQHQQQRREGLLFEASPAKKLARLHLNQQARDGCALVISATQEA
jgi:hypothetical protein